MADLLLTHGYFLAHDPREQEIMRPFPPLGLQYLVAWMRAHGFGDTEWWDATFAPGPEAWPLVLADHRPRVVGFYGHTLTRAAVRTMIGPCRDADVRVIAGGPDPVQSLDLWFDLGVEVVVIGEGEHTLQALMEHLRRNRWRWDWATLDQVDGVAFRRGGQVVRTRPRALIRPLDALPWPHRDRADLEDYIATWRARHGETAMSLTTSRGCPYHCTWCSKQVYGDTFRRRDVDAVIDEVLHLRRTFAPDQLWFVDDMFTINRRWVHRFCARMVERDAVTPFYVIGRPETLEPELVRALARAGCYRMYVSAESGAQHVLDAMRKESTVADIERGAALLHDAGIELGVFVMLGYPGEEKPDILATRDLLRRIDPAVTLLSVAHPMRGTAFHDAVEDRITGEQAGRLTFRMRHGARVYDAAQRMIWADRDRRRAEAPADRLRATARYAWWRGVFALAD